MAHTPRQIKKENCPACGAGPSFVVPVWEDMAEYWDQEPPDYLGCTECHTMETYNAK